MSTKWTSVNFIPENKKKAKNMELLLSANVSFSLQESNHIVTRYSNSSGYNMRLERGIEIGVGRKMKYLAASSEVSSSCPNVLIGHP
ncbi:MAG: hypothetical protein HYV29_13115 [Ignavibacteriales bacterium]|nr:hypothetical protein [Ignavibacteriales bacterium]